jgi:hypothetical protein
MLDDFTLKVSFLAAFLIVVSLFVSGYFSLRGDTTVKSLPSYLRHIYLNNDSCFQLNAIPTIGISHPILSYLSAVRYLFDGHRMLKQGYEKVI